MASGVGFRTRTLYSNSDEELFETRSPLLLKGIDGIATRADLLDRGLGVTLKKIPETERRTEEEVYAGFAAAHAAALGALLTALSAGLKNLSSVQEPNLPRMADFARWVCACEVELPWAAGTFLTTYRENRLLAAEESIENDPVAQAILLLARRAAPKQWRGSATDLLQVLNGIVEYELRGERWPRTQASLGRWLRRAEPLLAAVGVSLVESRTCDVNRKRLLSIGFESRQQEMPLVAGG